MIIDTTRCVVHLHTSFWTYIISCNDWAVGFGYNASWNGLEIDSFEHGIFHFIYVLQLDTLFDMIQRKGVAFLSQKCAVFKERSLEFVRW